jgi:hypothetical protein
MQLCEALGVEVPAPPRDSYRFELPVRVVHTDGTEATNYVDLYREGRFLLEAKDAEPGRSNELLMRRAFGQARNYVTHLPGATPPYLMVLDVGKTLYVWDRWSGSYGGFNAAHVIDLATLSDRPPDIALLRDIWQNPAARNPTGRAVAVTRAVAARLAELASSLEDRGHDSERVTRFLMRIVFTMFAEDVGLLTGEPFRHLVEEVGRDNPDALPDAISQLWRAMDEGSWWAHHKLLRFNGHFFANVEALPLTRDDIAILLRATSADWRDVEPAIFGTLLVRALDPAERHRLGAEFTPRSYVERVVRPALEAPIRERWTLVQAEVLQLRERGRPQDKQHALNRLNRFHEWLRTIRVLDPACGSGNFLYVAMDTMKRVELEVFREIEQIAGQHELGVQEVNPAQFHGIEVKLWARELAELTLWIGYHQWWARTHGATRPPEPVLQDTGTIQHRDAVLAWDGMQVDPSRSRPDPTPRIRHAVTGDLVPDPQARLPYESYEGTRQAEWPQADFIVGNPPFMGRGRQREAFGDGYVEALRAAYPDVPDNADFVMYWWARAAVEVASGRAISAGLITTNTITQRHNREVMETAGERGAHVAWAIPDHPWVDEAGSAAVRVAMTVIARDPVAATLVEVDDDGHVTREVRAERLHADLTADADIASAAAQPLLANRGLSSQGFTLVGEGFRFDAEEGERLRAMDARHVWVVRPIVNGRDLATRIRGIFTIDFGLANEDEARRYPVLFDIVRDRVKPGRDANNDRSTKLNWWRFGRNRDDLRAALQGLPRYIATVETAKHRVFQFLPAIVAAEHSVVCIATAEAYDLGVLSSRVHVTWALAAGGRLGIGNDARYQKAMCFDPFPFPSPHADLREHVATVAEKIETHRRDALARDEAVTMTGMYNVVAKLRSGEALTPKEQKVHTLAACGTLRDMHDELDELVAEAYGWSWPLGGSEILNRLVRLHDERVAEEITGLIRWLRPEYQVSRFGEENEARPELDLVASDASESTAALSSWPADVIEQLSAIRNTVTARACSVEEAAATYRGARRDTVAKHLETLAVFGEVARDDAGRYYRVVSDVNAMA